MMPDKMTDEILREKLAAIQSGDMKAFEEVYQSLKTPIMTVAARMTGDRQTAEDILQEVFVRLYKNPPDPKLSKPRAYIFRMARNLAIDSIRSIEPSVNIDECEDVLVHKDADSAEKLDIEAALSALPDAERQTVVLHINGGLKFREIAQITAAPLGTVLWRYNRAVGRLRALLEIK